MTWRGVGVNIDDVRQAARLSGRPRRDFEEGGLFVVRLTEMVNCAG